MHTIAEQLFELAGTQWGLYAMLTHSFLESFILPLAHELFLIPVAIAKPEWSFYYALLSTLFFTCGTSVGYLIGKHGGRPLLVRFIPAKALLLATNELHRNDTLAIAVACFSPIPTKVFTLIAGAAHVNFKKVLIISFLARGARYLIVCTLIYIHGSTVKPWLVHYFGPLTMAFMLSAIAPPLIWAGWKKLFPGKAKAWQPVVN